MNKKLIIGILAVILVLGLFVHDRVFGDITKDNITSDSRFVNYRFFATSTDQTVFSTTTSAVSTAIAPWYDSNGRRDTGALLIAGASKVTFFFSRAWGTTNTGSTTFSVEVSPNGTDWYSYGNLVSATSSASTLYSSYVIEAATSTVPLSMNFDYDAWYMARCKVVEATDGTHACSASVSY